MVNDIVEKEETKENKKNKKKNKMKKLPKEISQEILKKMFKNLLRAVGIMLYFIILNLAYSNMNQERLIGDIEVFAGVFLIIGIIFLEIAYKKDDGSIAVNGIEFLVLSLHSLSIMHVITLFKYDFRYYLLTSSYIFSIYYVLKAIVLYTKGRREYLNSLSDISEIVKKDEPIKKEAKKRKTNEIAKNKHAEEIRSESNLGDKPIKKNKKLELNDNSETKIESQSIKKRTTSKIKKEVLKTSKVEEPITKKKTVKSELKTLQEKSEESPNNKNKTTNSKTKTTKKKMEEEKVEHDETKKKKTTKTKTIKEENPTENKTEKKNKSTQKAKTEETKTPEKKKRGRPKKEVTKND